jgi:hypothetical protein
MSTPVPVVRLMRLMTHINIGAMLGMAAWLLWSGWLLVTGQMPAASHTATAWVAPAHGDAQSTPLRLVPVSVDARASGHCLPAATAVRNPADAPLTGADL